MAPLPTPRTGNQILIKKRPLPFSFWPMYRSERRYGLQSTLFVMDPWTVIRDNIREKCPAAAKNEALSCLEQAKDFYASSMLANVASARPLQLYYCFLNLVKSLALTRGPLTTFDGAQHGCSEQLDGARRELIDARLDVYQSPNRRRNIQVFDEFLNVISGRRLAAPMISYLLPNLLPQILPGHRLWADAAKKTERFISVHEIRFQENKATRELWVSLYFFADDLTRLGVTHSQLLTESRISAFFREVRCTEVVDGRKLLCFEQITTRTYTARPSDEIPTLVNEVKHFLWATVASVNPYRRYYVYLAPRPEHPEVLPQLLSIYALTYYLGSITRYRPHHFDSILAGSFGSRIEEFISGQPTQFIYLIASEFANQEITRPSIV